VKGLVWHNIRHPLGITRKSANFAFAQEPPLRNFLQKVSCFLLEKLCHTRIIKTRNDEFAAVVASMIHSEPDLKVRFRLAAGITRTHPLEAAQVAGEVINDPKVGRSKLSK